MKAEIAVTAAADSVLAEYDRDLLDLYGLLMVDTGYGAEPSAERVRDRFSWYLEENLSGPGSFRSLSLTGTSLEEAEYAADDGGAPLRRQIYAYMAADPAGRALSDILVLTDRFQGISLPDGSYEAMEKQNRRDLEGAYRKGKERREALAGEEPPGEEGEEASMDDPLPGFSDFRQRGLLDQILGPEASLPSGSLSGREPLSRRARLRGTGFVPEGRMYPEADPALMDLYLTEKFRSFADREEPEGPAAGALTCQQEYILYGKDSDRENLEAAAGELMLVRTGINAAILLADEPSRAEAEAAALLVTVPLLIPEASGIFQTAFLLAWAYMESLQDVRILLEGGSLPLTKTRADFRTGLTSVFHPESPGGDMSSGPEGTGLTYESFLRIRLYLEPEEEKTLRAMDVMEAEVRCLPGRAAFRMDGCLTGLSLSASFEGRGGSFSVTRRTGYDRDRQ